jgi:hypothetical protein
MMATVEAMKKQIPEDRARLKQRNDKRSLVVQIHYISTPDIELRLSRAIDLLLETAFKSEVAQVGNCQVVNDKGQWAPDSEAPTRADDS